jgi:hypothetical protein
MRKWSAPELRKSKLQVKQKEFPMSISKTKVSPIRAVMGFLAMADASLMVLANAVLKALTGNASFPNPAVLLTTFGNDITVYSNAVTAALDGGKNAKSAREKAKKVVAKDLKQLAQYVENNCNDEMAIFTTSGFTARKKPTASGPVAVPTFKSLDYGAHPGEILVSIKSVTGAKSYNMRFGAMPPTPPVAAGSTPSSTPASAGATAGAAPGAAPSSWTILNVANIKTPIPIDNLTSGTLYAVQVQALGMKGLSAWSDSSTIMCP